MPVVVEIIQGILAGSEMQCHKCGKQGHIQRVCHSSTAVIQSKSTHFLNSAVVTLYPSQELNNISPIFQIVQLPELLHS